MVTERRAERPVVKPVSPATTAGGVDRFVRQLRALPEWAKISLGVGGGLFALVMVAWGRAIVSFVGTLLFWTVLVLAIAGAIAGIVMAVVASQRNAEKTRAEKQRQLEAEERARAEAALVSQRARQELLAQITSGDRQPLDPSGMTLLVRNSEVVWYTCDAQVLVDGLPQHAGSLFVTSIRIVFTSPQCPVDIPVSHVNAVDFSGGRLQITGKSTSSSQTFVVADPELVAAYIKRTVQIFHRQVDVGFEQTDSRYIPQEAKAAVWTRDGGKCRQCGAADYLEFDHIIPRAKGGANTAENLQLLCRRCNLQKSDRI